MKNVSILGALSYSCGIITFAVKTATFSEVLYLSSK